MRGFAFIAYLLGNWRIIARQSDPGQMLDLRKPPAILSAINWLSLLGFNRRIVLVGQEGFRKKVFEIRYWKKNAGRQI